MEFSQLIAWMVAVLGTIVAGIVVERLRSRPKLFFFFPSYFGFNIPSEEPGQTTRVNTSNVVVQNAGGAAASNVTVVFNHRPADFGNVDIVPARDYQAEVLPNGQYVMRLGTLAPGETCTINTLYYAESLRVESVRSDSIVAKGIPVNYQRQFPKWFEGVIGVLMAVGFAAILYWAVRVVLALWTVLAAATV